EDQMPRSLARRIAFAVVGLALITWLAIGAALFVVLRTLHADATTARLTDVTAPLAAQVRNRVADADARTILAALRDQVSTTEYALYVQLAGGQLVPLAADQADLTGLRVDPAARRGDVDRGTYRAGDGRQFAWAASILRNPGVPGVRALVLATEDRAGADALRDLLAALPVVIVVTIAVGGPIAVLIARSVTRPLRRLTEATRDLPLTTDPRPLPVSGPTEIRELTQRFNAMAAELAATRRHESDLLANLRHDLRTPLTVIGGFAAALSDGTATGPAAMRAAQAIGEEAGRLERLVAELGAIERLRAGSADLRPEVIDAAELLAITAERFRSGATARGVELSVIGSDHGPELTADRMAVERMLANLVSNALAALGDDGAAIGPNASPPGHVWLEAREIGTTGPGQRTGNEAVDRPGGPIAAGPDARAVVLSVTDDGPGFPPGATARAFERFYRADRARTGSGSGLGLAIVEELARAHGGQAVAENVAPRGARVSIVLPVIARPPEAVPPGRAGAAG
ncbi:MAG TPA: HAMP domain-containing sensor histidine kinase, partial [Candidatus Limnocylindrales bacterium]